MLHFVLSVWDSISAFFDSLRDVGAISPGRVPLIALFSFLGGLVLTRFTGSLGSLTLPVNTSALFIGAMVSNWLLQNVKWTVSNPIEAPLFLSLAGMIVASLLMMLWLQHDGVQS